MKDQLKAFAAGILHDAVSCLVCCVVTKLVEKLLPPIETVPVPEVDTFRS